MGFVRFAGTLRTPDMLAAFASSCLGSKHLLAFVAVAPDTLFGVFAVDFVSSLAIHHRESLGARFLVVFDCRGHGGSRSFLALCVLGTLGWEAGAFLATIMGTVVADFLGTEGGLAAVALTVDSHADLLLYSLCVASSGRGPLAWFESESVLGEESASSFLLDSVVLGCCGGVFGSS